MIKQHIYNIYIFNLTSPSFKFSFTPPQNEHFTPFENDLYDMVCNIEFKTGQNC